MTPPIEEAVEWLDELAKAATGGPWKLERCDWVSAEQDERGNASAVCGAGWWGFARVVTRISGEDADRPEGVANAAYIAAANPQAIRQLIAAYRARGEALDEAATLLGRGVKEALPDAMILALHTSPARHRMAADDMRQWASEAREFVARAALNQRGE